MPLGEGGFHFATGDFQAGAGFSYGLGFTDRAVGSRFEDPDRPNRVDVNALAAYSNAGYGQVGGELALRNLGGGPFSAAVRGQYYEFPQEDFFGFGPQSVEANRTSFLLESAEAGADVWWQPMEGWRVGGGVSYLQPSIGAGTDTRFPSAEELFGSATLPGFQAQPDFRRLDAWVDYDGRDNPSHPRAGGFYLVRFSDFHDQDLDAFDFWRAEVDVQHYLPLPQNDRVLALRATGVITDPEAGHQVPFYYQPTLGGKNTLRGFREFRFRDRNSLLLTAVIVTILLSDRTSPEPAAVHDARSAWNRGGTGCSRSYDSAAPRCRVRAEASWEPIVPRAASARFPTPGWTCRPLGSHRRAIA